MSSTATATTAIPEPSAATNGAVDQSGEIRLSSEQLDAFGAELDAIRQRVIDDRGEADVSYMQRVIKTQRGLEVAGRGLLWFGCLPPAWLAGTAALSLSKILDNMEIGHNVMHGQFDWTNDPKLSSKGFEWDTACPGDQWRHSHNYMHHTHTNIVGKDRDIGYGVLRMSEDQEWRPYYLGNPLYATLLATFFQYGVALHDVEFERIASGETTLKEKREHAQGDLAEGPPPDAQGLRAVPGSVRARVPVHPGGQRDRQPDPQPLGVHDHLLRPLPRRHAGVLRGGDRRRDSR